LNCFEEGDGELGSESWEEMRGSTSTLLETKGRKEDEERANLS